MLLLSLIGIFLLAIGASWFEVIMAYFFQLSNAIPVTMVLCLAGSTWVASSRLKEIGVFVSDSSSLNMAGLITVACFDKTGEGMVRLYIGFIWGSLSDSPSLMTSVYFFEGRS